MRHAYNVDYRYGPKSTHAGGKRNSPLNMHWRHRVFDLRCESCGNTITDRSSMAKVKCSCGGVMSYQVLKDYRKLKGLSQERCAIELYKISIEKGEVWDIPRESISYWENGVREMPYKIHLLLLAELGLPHPFCTNPFDASEEHDFCEPIERPGQLPIDPHADF